MKHLILATILGLSQLPTQVQTASSSVNVTQGRDQAGTDHFIVAVSNGSGVTYTAQGSPTLTNGYTQGQLFVMIPDVPSQANATLNIDGQGPVSISGTCSGSCILLAQGSKVSKFVVH
jgi:hypothetical protein